MDAERKVSRRELLNRISSLGSVGYLGAVGVGGTALLFTDQARADGVSELDLDLVSPPALLAGHLRLYANIDGAPGTLSEVRDGAPAGVHIAHVQTAADLLDAVDAAQAAGGGTIVMDAGDFTLSSASPMVISQPTRIVGMGPTLSRVTGSVTGGGPVFDVRASFSLERVGFSDLNHSVVSLHNADFVERVCVANCSFVNIPQYVINGKVDPNEVQGVGDLRIEACSFDACYSGIRVKNRFDSPASEDETFRSYVVGNCFKNMSQSSIQIGNGADYLDQDQSGEHIIVGNVIQDVDTTADGALYGIVCSGHKLVISHNVISNVKTVDKECYAIYTKSRCATISDNLIHEVRGTGIITKGREHEDTTPDRTQGWGNLVANNVIIGTKEELSGVAESVGIKCRAERTLVVGNYVGGSRTGVSHRFEGVVVSELMIIDNQIHDVAEAGIKMRAFQGLTIRGNTIDVGADTEAGPQAYVADGILLDTDASENAIPTYADLVIEDNQITSTQLSSGTGIYLETDPGIARARIRNNRIDNFDRGIGFYNSTSLYTGFVIEDNVIEASGHLIYKLFRAEDCIVRHNQGYVTESSGTTTVGTNNRAEVLHSLSQAPSVEQITVTPKDDLGNATRYWVDPASINSTRFYIYVDQDPGASGASFVWSVEPQLRRPA